MAGPLDSDAVHLLSRSSRPSCIFPDLTDGHISDSGGSVSELKVCNIDATLFSETEATCLATEIYDLSSQSAIVAAWALTIAKYRAINEVSFYTFVNTALRGTTSSCHLAASESTPLTDLLRESRRHLTEEHDGGHQLNEVTEQHLLGELSSEFSNIALVFDDDAPTHSGPVIDQIRGRYKSLVLNISRPKGIPNAYLTYTGSLLSETQAANLAATFAKVFSSLAGAVREETALLVGDVDFMSSSHIDQIWSFNASVPEPWAECFHDVVRRHALDQPSSLAVDAWDVQLSYGELLALATRLSAYLQSRGVRPGVVVPLSFERSAWAVVSMLAVSIAGGAFLSIPPYLPEGRSDAMIEKIAPPLLLTTSTLGPRWEGRVIWVPIDGYRIMSLPNCDGPPKPLANPSDMFYLIFTSGSTGQPKGCVISHSSFLTGALKRAPEWNYGRDSRVLQMLAHTFDMSLLEICTSLGSGACVCVPRSEEVEESLSGCIQKYRVNHAVMTPSLARHLHPDSVPGLKTLCLGGEAFTKELVILWSHRLKLFQFYGPSECSINSSTREIDNPDADPLNIGPPNSAACWVVEPGNHHKLVPVGAIGELLVSGPIVGLGYFKDPIRTSQVFISGVEFVKNDPKFRDFVFYKTGDLVRWNSDGTLIFCGRADTQVKLNGQRLELGEVEYHLALDPEIHLAIALVPQAGRCQGNLLAVITPKTTSSNQTPTPDISVLRWRKDAKLRNVVDGIRSRLYDVLPRYMVPTIWAFLACMPISSSGKVDRVHIRKWVEGMSEEVFSEITSDLPESERKLDDATILEQKILEVWSSVLKRPKEQVGLDRPFVFLGGDSVQAQDVVARCRQRGIHVNIRDILSCQGVAEASSRATIPNALTGSSSGTLGYGLLEKWRTQKYRSELLKLGLLGLEDIEDVHPCSLMQEGMFIGQIRRPGAYHLRFFFKIAALDIDRPTVDTIKDSWRAVVQCHPGLRTIFVEGCSVDAAYHSVILRRPTLDIRVREVREDFTDSQALEMFTGPVEFFEKHMLPHRLKICSSGDRVSYLSWEVSHAIIDGAGLETLLRDFVAALARKKLDPGPSYGDFVAYQMSRDTADSARYWSAYSKDSQPCMFPVRTHSLSTGAPEELLRMDFSYGRSQEFLTVCRERNITVACAIRASWALVLRTYTSSDKICFGYVSSGRENPVKNIGRMIGLCLSVQLCRILLNPESTLQGIANVIQQDYIESLPHHHFPLYKSGAIETDEAKRPMFNTAISMEWVPKVDPLSGSPIPLQTLREQDDPTEYDIAISVDVSDDYIKFGFLYWPSLTQFDIRHAGNALMEAFSLFIDKPNTPLHSLSLVNSLESISAVHAQFPPLIPASETVMTLIERKSLTQPHASAMVSWDGEFSYSQVIEMTTMLARILIRRGVRRGDRVLICLPKSCRTVVVILAVALSGAVLIATTNSQLGSRIMSIINHSQPKIIISDPNYMAVPEVSQIDTVLIEELWAEIMLEIPSVDSQLPMLTLSDNMTIIYTSGSTAEPKGIIMNHGSLATAVLQGHGKSFRFSERTRIFQFASFTFDASLMEIFTTLTYGGCVCIPSEAERLSRTPQSISNMGANMAFFTPSVLRLLQPDEVPSLKTIVAGGELMTREDVQRWAGAVDLYNGYGPAETTIFIACHGPLSPDDDPRNMGYAVDGTRLWVAESANTERLVPPGCIGELIVQSRQVTSGYLDSREMTVTSFIEPPGWLKNSDPNILMSEAPKLYKTGDLVRQNPDGTLNFIGRIDTQVKIHGQRIELAEVESRLSECLLEADKTVVEVITLHDDPNRQLLCAFVNGIHYHATGQGKLHSPPTRSNAEQGNLLLRPMALPASVRKDVAERLPRYMIPAVFLETSMIPMTVSGKTDRRKLIDTASLFSTQELADAKLKYCTTDVQSFTQTGETLRRLWSRTLRLDPETIRHDDDFFDLGGDSIMAMKLAASARKLGTTLSVSDIFLHPTIRGQCALFDTANNEEDNEARADENSSNRESMSSNDDSVAGDGCSILADSEGPSTQSSAESPPPSILTRDTWFLENFRIRYQRPPTPPSYGNIPFSSVEDQYIRRLIIQAAIEQCKISEDEIEDMYPCTPLQEGMIALTAKQPEAYVSTFSYTLPAQVDVDRLRGAWARVAHAQSILRTRIVQVDSLQSFQVVHHSIPILETNTENTESIHARFAPQMGLGTPLCRVVLMNPNSKHESARFVVCIHHAIYDGRSLPLLLRQVETTYQHGSDPSTQPFKHFVDYLSRTQESATKFWKEALESMNNVVFPSIPHPEYVVETKSTLNLTIKSEQIRPTGFTLATRLKLAWAITVSTYANTDDVVFGTTSSGRGVPLAGIDDMIGPTIATAPMRIRVKSSSKVSEALQEVQRQSALMMKYEHLGLQNISRLGPGPAIACHFQTLLVIQAEEPEMGNTLFTADSEFSDIGRFDTYALALVFTPRSDTVNVDVFFDPEVMKVAVVRRILQQVEHTLCQIDRNPNCIIASLELIRPEELQDMRRWNSDEEHGGPIRCIHDSIHEVSLERLDAPAVCSWDGSFSYRELDNLSSALAANLQRRGVGPECFVPLCFQKSKWFAVAQLGVMKAGGAFVPLSERAPESRIREILKEIQATCMLASEGAEAINWNLGLDVVIVGQGIFPDGRDAPCPSWAAPSVTPANALCVIFTSGTTGKPKGIVLDHASYSASSLAHIEACRLNQSSRVLQFAGYEFDASILDHLSTLLAGGCICIPSENDRMDRLSEAARKFGVTWAVLTPPVARCISPQDVPTLETLILVGEPMSQADIESWSPHVKLMNAYGISECSIISTISSPLGRDANPHNIGLPLGCACWVVDSNNCEKLLPVGSVGELLITGPTIGRGYLNNVEATAAAFIPKSYWLHSTLNSADRVYRTGDLAYYHPDGSIQFVGRKDTQVKLRGQRIELSEVEHHLRRCLPNAFGVVAELGSAPDDRSDVLVAFICSGSARHTTDLPVDEQSLVIHPTIDFLREVQSVGAQLRERLPSYMVPSVFLSLARIPLTKSGKTDRSLLRRVLKSLPASRFSSIGLDDGSNVAPSNEMEKKLREIWARVLKVDAEKIGVNKSFLRIGGDSITAMKLSTECRAMGIQVSSADIFRHKTISELAARASETEYKSKSTWFPLSPPQQVFIRETPERQRDLHPLLFLAVENKHENDVAIALNSLVGHHEMLRVHFKQSREGEWMQSINPRTDGCYRFDTHNLHSEESIRVIVQNTLGLLDTLNGPVLAASLLKLDGRQVLFLLAHGLAIDEASMRIVRNELQCLLAHKFDPSPVRPSYRSWCEQQLIREAQNPVSFLRVLQKESQIDGQSSFGAELSRNTSQPAKSYGFSLNEKTSSLLLTSANQALRTKPVEIFYAALLHSFVQTQVDQFPPIIFAELDGRERYGFDLGVANTVGCFTTFVTTTNGINPNDGILEIIRRAKDGLRLDKENPTIIPEYPVKTSVVLLRVRESGQDQNLGSVVQFERLGQALSGPSGQLPSYPFSEVTMMVTYNQISCRFLASPQQDVNFAHWVECFESTLTTAAETLVFANTSFTLSDFPLLRLTDERIDTLVNEILPSMGLKEADIEDIYPCSDLQQGILLCQARHGDHYRPRITWRLSPADSSQPIEITRLERAWQKVVDRHPALRTIFLNASGRSLADQLVMKQMSVQIDDGTSSRPASLIPSESIDRSQETKGEHSLFLRAVSSDHIICELQINHAVMDARSIAIIQRDLALAYDDRLIATPNTFYRDYIAYLHRQKRESTLSYWTGYLEGIQPCLFPRFHEMIQDEGVINCRTVTVDICDESLMSQFCSNHGISPTALYHFAWALVLRCYVQSQDVCFGYISHGRDVPLEGIQDAVGAFVNLLVKRTRLADEDSILSGLKKSMDGFVEGLPHQHCALLDIHHSINPSGSSMFNTVISIRTGKEDQTSDGTSIVIEQEDGYNVTEYDIVVEITTVEKIVSSSFTFQESLINHEQQALWVAQTFRKGLLEIIRHPSQLLSEISLLGDEQYEHLCSWNRRLPEEVDRCVHNIIRETCVGRSDAIAVSAWDGEFSYGELDELSTTLATHLRQAGVGLEIHVPICFEKSKWAIVAILSTLKVGGAFVLLDPSYPLTRLEDICRHLNSKVVLASNNNITLASSLASTVIVVGLQNILWEEGPLPSTEVATAAPENAAYVMFTSGSTGTPKGVTIEHRSLCSTIKHQIESFHLTQRSRVLQFASYAFDAAILDILATLCAGGCVCVPSDSERLDLVAAMNRYDVNWACLTSSVARILSPELVPSLETLVLAGEVVTETDISLWSKIDMIVAYGLTECAITCVVQESPSLDGAANNIGFGQGIISWIVNPQNVNELLPLGAVGELVLEGPVVGRGYLGDDVLTKKAFINPPPWRSAFPLKRTFRLYKTGDLVRYALDGSICYLGRKDSQIKLRGQRIELGDVETHVRRQLSMSRSVSVDIVNPNDGSSPYLVAFFTMQPHSQHGTDAGAAHEGLFLPPTDEYSRMILRAREQLQKVIPNHMIPSVFLPVYNMPIRLTGKVDSERLRNEAALLERDKIAAYTLLSKTKKVAASQVEEMLHRILSKLLGLPVESIGMDDSIFRLGGDSLTAMKLVSSLYQEGFQVSVRDIFSQQSISSLAPKVQPAMKAAVQEPAPFSLLPDGQTKDIILPLVADQCQVHTGEVEDVYPTTPLQESLYASTMKQQGAYVAEFTYETVGEIDIDNFKAAWCATSQANPILRTRIVQIDGRDSFQVVLRSDETIRLWSRIEDYKAHNFPNVELGRPLLYVSLIQQNSSSGGYIFVLRIHHALYDSWSLSLLLEQLDAAYRGRRLVKRPFSSFVQSLSQRQFDANRFWKEEFSGISAIQFPVLPTLKYEPSPARVIRHHIPYVALDTGEMTLSSKLRLAWAIMISKYTGSRDVIFGVTVAGRNPSILGIDKCTGPTIATVPFRVYLDPEVTIEENLKRVQTKSLALIPFEQSGLQHISHLSDDALTACNFQSLLVVQPKQARHSLTPAFLVEREAITHGKSFSTYAISMICEPSTDGITFQMIFDEVVVPAMQAWRITHQLESILLQLERQPAGLINELSISLEDRKQIYEWNRNPVKAVERCVHESIVGKSLERPDAVAICSWDGDFTYKDIDILSFKVAQKLTISGLGPETFVPIYMSRSRWIVVAILGILRAGAAFVLLDPSHESERHREVCRLVQATLIISSAQDSPRIANYGHKILEVGDETTSWTNDRSCQSSVVHPSNAAYAIFTSGTTGTPKGSIIEHVAFATSAVAHSSALRMEPTSRVLHHASYAFDAAVLEILTTLLVGACICIPSEVERGSRMHEAIIRMNVNWVCLTPTLSRIVEPEGLSCLQTLVLAGEAPNAADIAKWSEQTHLILAYGLSECAICCTATTPRKLTDDASDIGGCTGCVAWIADENDYTRLAPIGSIGELLIEGPTISRGYLGGPERTASSFVRYPEWLASLRGDVGEKKLYRTGDLVKYSANGVIQFVGRRDTQVKLRGQRLELTDVEHHVRNSFPGAVMVIADIVSSMDTCETMLVAFVWKGYEGFAFSEESEVSVLAPPSDNLYADIAKAEKQLKNLVPPFMRPNTYLPLSYVPFASTSKVDRGLLRQHAERLSREQVIQYRSRPMTISLPTSKLEKHVQELVARVLRLPVEGIGLGDHFFHLGGDSIAAMKLAGAARQADIDLTVPQIFSNPILSDLASVAKEHAQQNPDVRPRPVFHGLCDSDVQKIAADWGLPLDNIVDILPTTEFQREYIRTQKSNYFIIPLPAQFDHRRVKAAIELIVERCTILRTAFVPFHNTFLQVVFNKSNHLFSEWTGEDCMMANDTKNLCQRDSAALVAFGTSHFKAIFVTREKSERSLVLRLSHAQYDAISMPLLIEHFVAAYQGTPMPSTASLTNYISWREDQDHLELAREWEAILSGSQMTYASSVTQSRAELDGTEDLISLSQNVPSLSPVEGFTMATMHKAAWALVLARRTQMRDLVFGQVTSGRDSTLDLVMGACVQIMPVRVTLQPSWETSDVLDAVQSQHARTMALQAVDFEDIVSQSTKWPQNTRFGSIVQHQNIESGPTVTLDGVTLDVDTYVPGYVPSSIYSTSKWEGNCLQVSLSASTQDLDLETTEELLKDLCHVLRCLSHNAPGPVLDMLGMSDLLPPTKDAGI
ncbi:hypothetical protein F4861DRAFT_146977 [Xylaria intraflava]|nr:hypothetical protein F4861DRAFT_146977 [Xylaria intraflava]